MRMSIHTQYIYTNTYTHTLKYNVHAYVYVCIMYKFYVHIYKCICVCLYIYSTYRDAYLHEYINIHTFIYINCLSKKLKAEF